MKYSMVVVVFVIDCLIYVYAFTKGCNIKVILFLAIISLVFLWIVGRSIYTGVVALVGRGPVFRTKTPLLFYTNLGIFGIGSICAAALTLSKNFYN